MEVICIQDKALWELVDKVVDYVKTVHGPEEDKWVNDERAMQMLNCKRTTLQKYRDEGRINFSQPDRKIILYDRYSIQEYLDKNEIKKF